MASFAGILQRPLVAATAVAAASVSADFHPKFPSFKPHVSSTADSSTALSPDILRQSKSSWVSHISVSKLANLSFVTTIRVPIPNINFPNPNSESSSVPHFYSPVIFSPILLNLHQSAALSKAPKPAPFSDNITSQSDVMYRWHLPEPKSLDISGNSGCSSAKSRTVVVLLGWLGSKQRHLKKYAEWYTSRGFHAITFTFPMAEILTYQVGGKAEHHIDLLVNHLADWLDEEEGKNLIFHTFSNTGWLTYGAILEKFKREDPSLIGRIKGCVVDSAPVAAPDPQVWASGFSAAFLKKNSVATKGTKIRNDSDMDELVGEKHAFDPKPAVTETALLLVLEKFFEVILNLPTVNRRLGDVLGLLSSAQPGCPQLYMYSSADRVIPAASVETFMEQQRRAGREVRACNFVSTPHVDHFRNDPILYSSQLTLFLEDCVLTCCKQSH